MKKILAFLESYKNTIEKILKILILIIFSLSFVKILIIPASSGDESLFLKNLDLINSIGWKKAIENKIALTYLLLVYPFTFIFKNYIALRLVNILLFIVLLFYFKKYGSIKNKMFYYYLLFFSCNGWFLIGTNDALFIISLVVFFNETYKITKKQNNYNLNLLFISLFIAFFTRQLVYLYLPVIIVSLYFVYKENVIKISKIKFSVVVLFFLILINIPSLIKNNNFSYDNKVPPSNFKSNWSQRVYLAQIMVNNNEIPYEAYPSWEQTDMYIEKNGQNSLPQSTLESVFFDIKLTFKEFIKNFCLLLFFSIRQSGIMLLFVVFYFITNVFKTNQIKTLFIPLILIKAMLLFSFVIISNVQIRWLVPIYIISLLYFCDLKNSVSLKKNIFTLNNLVLICIVFYGIYKLYKKAFLI